MKRTGNSKIAVVGWGRGMGHKGHMYLADAVITQATNMKADPYFFVSKTVGKDDPVFPEEKVRIYQKVFPQYAPIFTPEGNLNQALQELAQLGYQGVVVVVGADQKKAFQYLEGNNKEGVPVYQSLGLKKLRVISRQETNSKFANEEGPRATPMREILLNPDASEEDKFEVWRRDMPEELSDREVLDIMNKAESRLIHSNAPKVLSQMSKKAAKLKEAIMSFKVKKSEEQPEKDSEPFGYKHLFKQPGEPEQKPVEKHYHGWEEYEKEQNPDAVEEGRIIDANAKVDLYYVTPKGARQKIFQAIPQRMLDKAIAVLQSKYPNINPNDIEMRPAGHSEYTRTEGVAEAGFTKTPSGDYINQHTGVRSSKPPVKKKRGEKTGAEWDAIEKAKKDKEQGVVNEFAIDKPDDGDGRSKLISSIVRLLQAGNRVDFFVPGIRGHVVGAGSDGQSLTLKRWKKPYSKVNYSLDLDSSDDNRFVLKMINPDYYQVVEKQDLNEFAPDDGDESRKFIPWNEFVDQLKQILHKDFDCKESINMDVIKAKFVPYDPMEYGPTMIYSYFERRAGRKGANGVRGQIQVGNFFKGSKPGDNQLMTGYHLLKGTEFERYFDLTFDNIYKIANIIQGNTQGALEFKPEQVNEFAPSEDNRRIPEHYILEKDRYNLRSKWKKSYDPEGGGVLLFTTKEEALQAVDKFNRLDKNREFKYGGTQMSDIDEQGVAEGPLNEFAPDYSGDSGQEDMFFKYAKMWYNGNLKVQQRVEEILAQAGWEIGPLESEEGGAFIVQSGDENGDTYMGWSAEELQGIDESSTDYLDEK